MPRLAITFLALALSCILSFAQDDPRYDNSIGFQLPESGVQRSGPAGINVITTSDGFDNFDLGITNAEPHMSSNPQNSLWYFNAYNTNSTFRTTNGITWTPSTPNFGVPVNGDPLTAYDSLGNLYYETMFGGITGCKVIRSTDNGATWTPAVTSVAGVDKNWMACDQTSGPFANYVYTCMTANSGGNFARSTDFGTTWTTTFSPTTQSLPGMMVAVGPNVSGGNSISGGCVYLVTHSGSNAAGVYTFYASTDGGASFSLRSSSQFSNYIGTEITGRSTVQGMRCRPYPMIVADNSFGPFRGRLYLVYASNNPSGNANKSDIFLRYSTDQGVTWSSAAVANDDPNSQNNFQFHPAIWCDKETGRLYIKFYDTRRVATSDSMDVYATYSDDGGVSFAPNQRLTNRTFRINFTGAAGPTYRGDYDAITSNKYSAMAVWTDFRNSGYLGMTAYFPDFAMLVAPAVDTLGITDSTNVSITVPAVKLYTHSARFSATVSPAANITFSFPQGDSLTAYPDSLPMTIKTNNASQGTYTVTITGEGPNGTPVHRRTMTVVVRYIPNTLALQEPNGGEIWISGTNRSIVWTTTGLVDSVRLEYSTNNGTAWNVITAAAPASTPYNWLVPATPSSQALVRVTWLDSANVSDQSSAVFTISNSTPIIVTTPDSLVATIPIGPNASIDTLRIGNAGNLNLNWTLSESLPWLAASPGSGSVPPGDSTDIVLTFNATGLDGRTYNGSVTISSNDIHEPLRTIPVRLTVTTRPGISIPVMAFNHGTVFTGDTTGQSITIRSVGTGMLNVTSLSISNGNDYAAIQNGTQVVPPVVTSGSGTGSLTLNGPGTQLSYNLRVAGLSGAITSAHFHAGRRGANGGIVRTLTFVGDSCVGVWLNTGIGPLTVALVDSLRRGRMYIDVHTATNPTGEIRGQMDGSFFMDTTPLSILPGDSVVRTIYFSPVTVAALTGSIRLVTNDPDASDDTLFVSLTGVGQTPPLGVADVRAGIPSSFELTQNYPNPFNPSTRIEYGLPQESIVSVRVYNLLGQEVITLVDGSQNAGYHSVEWNSRTAAGSSVSSGVYFYRLEARPSIGNGGNGYVAIKKMLLVQ